MTVLIVDDFQPWRDFACSMLDKVPGLEVIAQASDGLQATQKAKELQPDLILLDIGLPGLNGIEAARQIRKCAPRSQILFASENRTGEVVDAALDTGALGYIAKSDAASEMLPALDAVLHGKRHVSTSLTRPALV
jgi:DNA-binding NarL/FixJ family response regulator